MTDMRAELQLQVSPCEGGFPQVHNNGENVETYSIWPYEYFAVNRSTATNKNYPHKIGLNTFNNVHFGHGDNAWRYDGQDAALLGMAQYAWNFAVARIMHQGRTEGSQFPGYLAADYKDGAPEVESNGIVSVTLQKMLVQTDGARILVFPAFLKGLDVDFKVYIPGWGASHSPAQMRVVLNKERLVSVEVSPLSRRADVEIMDLQ